MAAADELTERLRDALEAVAEAATVDGVEAAAEDAFATAQELGEIPGGMLGDAYDALERVRESLDAQEPLDRTREAARAALAELGE